MADIAKQAAASEEAEVEATNFFRPQKMQDAAKAASQKLDADNAAGPPLCTCKRTTCGGGSVTIEPRYMGSREFVKKVAGTLTPAGVARSKEITLYVGGTGDPGERAGSHTGEFARAGIGGMEGHVNMSMLITRVAISPELRKKLQKDGHGNVNAESLMFEFVGLTEGLHDDAMYFSKHEKSNLGDGTSIWLYAIIASEASLPLLKKTMVCLAGVRMIVQNDSAK
jgi:hypothetical protein